MSNKGAKMLMGAAALLAMSMTSCAAVADDPVSPPKPLIVGGPCIFATQPGTLTVTSVDTPPAAAVMVHFEFRPKGQDRSDGAALEAAFASIPPSSPGQSFPGWRETETHGSCPALFYGATIAGKTVRLTIMAYPK